MFVGIFASAFYPHTGGVEETVRQLAHEEQRRGHKPIIFTNRWPKSLPSEEIYEGLPVRRYVFRVPEMNVRQLSGAILYGPVTLQQMCSDLQRLCIEIVHVQCASNNAYYAMLASRRLKLPLVVTLQGELTMDSSGLYQRSTFARKMLTTLLEEADAVTACSQQTLAEAESFFGKPLGERGRVIYNGIRLEDFDDEMRFEHPRPYILGIGRHVHQKGFDILLTAFAQVVDQGDNNHDLIIAGDGNERPRLEKLALDLGVTHKVRFMGMVDRSTAARLFTGCSFFVLPSRHEPMGIVNLEAMAAGKAIIASRVGGVSELVFDGHNGLLVPSNDAGALAQAIGCLIDDVPLRLRLGTAGRKHVRQFQWSTIANEYEAVYEYASRNRVAKSNQPENH